MLFSANALWVLEFCYDTGVTCILLYLTHCVDLELVPSIRRGRAARRGTEREWGRKGRMRREETNIWGEVEDRQDEETERKIIWRRDSSMGERE